MSPVRGRGIYVTLNQLFITFGIFINYTILYTLSSYSTVLKYTIAGLPFVTGLLGLITLQIFFKSG